MSKEIKRYTVTSALPYANGPVHIGHLAGAYLPADIYVRFLRNQNKDVAFICGSDEHGAAITLRAKKEGISPQEIVDKYHGIIKQAFEDFGISFDIYHRTSAPSHHKTAQDFFKKLDEKGGFVKQTSEQFFDEEHQQFLADRYIMGTCPKCNHDAAYGDQCEKCGSALSPLELINPVSTLSGKTPVLKETTHWYLPMGKHEDWIRPWIEEGKLDGEVVHDPKAWKNQVVGQCKSWIDAGLQERAMTRDLDWGVKVPYETADGKVLYVWLDAPIGYISATKEWAAENNKDWEPYWKDKETKLVHFIGKDNIVFHCIIFPMLLKEEGSYILPENVPANEFLNLEGDKISTSRNWAIWLHEYLEDFKGKEDELRYTLTAILPENRDSEFTWKDFQTRVNNELVANPGNFVNRALVLTNKYYEGTVPEKGELLPVDLDVIQQLEALPAKLEEAVHAFRFRDALDCAMKMATIGNQYFSETEPWKLIKQDPERVKTIIHVAVQICANLTLAFDAFLPFTTAKLRGYLNMEAQPWDQAGKMDLIPAGHRIEKGALLFQKIEDEVVEQQIAKLEASRPEAAIDLEPAKETIQFEDFTKMDIRIGEVLEAEKVKKTKKLLKLKIDTGIDTRTVVSGIAEFYAPEEVVGKKVSILVNLSPRKIKGIESEGMILMAENAQGELAFVSPEKDVDNGGTIR